MRILQPDEIVDEPPPRWFLILAGGITGFFVGLMVALQIVGTHCGGLIE